MSDVRAWELEEGASAAPSPDGQLHVLAAPDAHGGVVRAGGEEEAAVNGKRATYRKKGEEEKKRMSHFSSLSLDWYWTTMRRT